MMTAKLKTIIQLIVISMLLTSCATSHYDEGGIAGTGHSPNKESQTGSIPLAELLITDFYSEVLFEPFEVLL